MKLRVLVAILLLAAARPVLAQQGSLAAAVVPFVEKQSLAGAVMLVSDKQRDLAIETAGFADIANRKPMRADTLFWIASQSKPITAAALMILVDEGKVRLDDPVEKFLPEFKGQMVVAEKDKDRILLKSPARQATVRDCLNHTSGMPFKSALEEPTLDALSLATGVRGHALTPLEAEPGSRYRYSNAGINTAGRIVEVVSGMPFEVFLDKRLLRPLGMTDTTFWPAEARVARLALSYRPDAAKTGLQATPIIQLRYPLSDKSRGAMPAGGLFATAADCSRFCRMILNGGVHEGGRILSEESVKALTTRQTPSSMQESYGLGFAVGPDTAGHGGAHATSMNINFKTGRITVWMVQHAGFPADGAQARGAFEKAAALVK